MANKGSSRHMSALAAPRFYAIHGKEHRYVVKPNPGRHTLERSLAVGLVLGKLGVAARKNDVSRILKSGNVHVNGKVIREIKYPVGLNDVIELKHEGKSYRIGVDSLAKISLESVKKAEAEPQTYKVVGKYKAGGGVVMIRLNDGRCLKAEHSVKVNDSVALGAKGAVKKVLPMAVGAKCIVIDGVHVGKTGKVKEVKKGTMNVVPTALVEPESGDQFETLIKNIMVTG